MSPRRLRILTTGRADWNILGPVARALGDAEDFDLQLIVAGGHLDPDQGLTVEAVRAEGLSILAEIDWGPAPASARAARILAGMAAVLEAGRPDLLLVLGDRFEVLAAAQAAVLAGTPLVHLAGGDVTEGAMDDAFRHALTKLSHLHLVMHDQAARRVRQLGEAPDRIHVVGNPVLDDLRRAADMPIAELERRLAATLGARNLLVTFHSVTLLPDHGAGEFEALLTAFDRLDPGWTLWFTAPNADPGGVALAHRLEVWAAGRSGVHVRAALGGAYAALAARCEAVVGNSSSGLAEVPTLGTPTVDVGDRQRGRLAGPSVIHARPDADDILAALDRALALGSEAMTNPYGDGQAVPRILAALRDAPSAATLLRKPFVDQEAPA